jgi:5-methylcytosine-specific restriction protein A
MQPPQAPIPFAAGQQYTRDDIFDVLGIEPHPPGGNWFTGYNRHGQDWYVFAHIDTAGRTGHDYGNGWEGGLLRWRGKTGSHLGQDSIQSMLSPQMRVLIFTREHDRDPFTFQGVAVADDWVDTVPVTIWWRFPDPNNAEEVEDARRPEAEPEAEEQEAEEQGAGFGAPEENTAVEQAAVAFVTAHYTAEGWAVTSVEVQRIGYDLTCTRQGEERHVEVKGVSGSQPVFMLTEGERHRAATDPRWRVAIVTVALGPNPQLLEVSGADLLDRWTLDPINWRVSPPSSGA